MILTIFNVDVNESMNVLLISVKKVNGLQSTVNSHRTYIIFRAVSCEHRIHESGL